MLFRSVGALAGFLLGAPTLGLRGDYLAIVTLGFGEIVQDTMKNLDAITKGTQGINPLPPPTLPWMGEFGQDERPWYWLFLAITALAVVACRNLERSRTGRAWLAVRGYDPAFGARPLGRLVQTELRDKLADAVLFGTLQNGGSVHVDVAGDALALTLTAS